MRRIKCTVSYDGTNYFGFQHQEIGICIEDVILTAIQKIDTTVEKIYGSGRTDRYVHARGQVIHFDTDKEIEEYKWVRGINRFLPEDIRVLEARYVAPTFHARFQAIRKEYRYYIRFDYDVFYRNYMELCPPLNIEAMKDAVSCFEGTHDFRGLCSAKIVNKKDTVRTIEKAEIIEHKDYLEIIFIGDGFLKYQVRKMVGLLVDIGLGRKTKETIALAIETKDPCVTTKLLGGQGLYLMRVEYEGE